MYFTNDSLLPENQEPLIITAAPFGPQWMPSDYPEDIAVSWEDQVQKAVDCYNAGATLLHVHVRDPKTGHVSKNFQEYADFIGMLRNAVPKMVLQIGGSISFAPAADGSEAHWQGYDTRHMLTEIDPKPDQITIVIGSTQMDILPLTTADDVQGTQLANPAMQAAYQNMVADATPGFYIEHLKRLREHQIQPYFQLAHIHQLEAIEHLIRTGVYMGPLNHNLVAIGGAGGAARNPFDFMEYVRRSPHGSCASIESLWRTVPQFGTMGIVLGIHIRVGIEDNMWRRKGCAHDLGRADRADGADRHGTRPSHRDRRRGQANSQDRRLVQLRRGDAGQSGLPPNRKDGQLGFIVKETDGRLRPPRRASTPSPGNTRRPSPPSSGPDRRRGTGLSRGREESRRPSFDGGTVMTTSAQPTGPWDEPALDERARIGRELGRGMPEMTTDPWTNGILPLKEVELVCIAINAACTNLQAGGTRRHIRAALAAGATREEMLRS